MALSQNGLNQNGLEPKWLGTPTSSPPPPSCVRPFNGGSSNALHFFQYCTGGKMSRTTTKQGKAETTFPSDRNRRGLSDHCAQVARHVGRIQVAALANNVHPDRMIVLLRVLLENVFQPTQCMDLGGLTHG